MEEARIPENEPERLEALAAYGILDSLPERVFDDLTFLAAQICDVPIALISLVDKDRQWWKSKVGLPGPGTPRGMAFCAHAILNKDNVLVVPNALKDSRFSTNPLVTGDPNIRFYAGAPLVTPEGYALGALCVIDRVPKKMNEEQIKALGALGRQVMGQMELRLKVSELEKINHIMMDREERILLLKKELQTLRAKH